VVRVTEIESKMKIPNHVFPTMKPQTCMANRFLGAFNLLSLTPRFSGVLPGRKQSETVSTVSIRRKTVETVFASRAEPSTPLKRGVNETRRSDTQIRCEMSGLTLATLLLATVLLAASLPATAADLSQLIADTAKWESSQSREPLDKVEQLVRESVGKKGEQAKVEAALVKLLAPDSTFEAKRFACQQLSVIGSDASVTAIAKLLKNDETIGIACLAFGSRPSAKADKALCSALTAAKGQGGLQIISTLGERRVGKAVKSLADLAKDSDAAMADAAIRALGKIANEAASKVLADLRKQAKPPFSDSLADASLRCAAVLTASGKTKAATAIAEELVIPVQSTHVRRGAFKALLASDADGGEQRILQTVRGSDATLKPVAIAAVSSLKGQTASEASAEQLPKLPPQEQVWLINALAVRADAAARGAILGRLDSSETAVRLAAAAAIGRVGGATAVKPLAKALAAAKDADEIRALQSALSDLPSDRDVEKAIIAEIRSAETENRARLVATLATRRSSAVISALFAEAKNTNDVVATAAYKVLAKAGAGEHLPLLLKQYVELPDTDLRFDVQGYVEQAIVATDDASIRSRAVCDVLAKAGFPSARCSILDLMPAAGTDEVLAALLTAVNGTDGRERDSGVHALSQWPTMSAWDALYAIVRKPLNEAYRSITFRSLVRLAGDANANPDDKLMQRYRDLLAGSRDAADLKQILGALGGAVHPEALQLAKQFEGRPDVKAEADVAIKKITESLKVKRSATTQ
jgi:HEAT repeat protein